MAHLCTRAWISHCVERDYLSERAMRGREGGLYRETFELFRAREMKIFNLAEADLICHVAATRIRLISRFFAKGNGNSAASAESHNNRCLPSNPPRNYFGSLSSARFRNCGRIREHQPWDFHYQRQRGRGPPCPGFKAWFIARIHDLDYLLCRIRGAERCTRRTIFIGISCNFPPLDT